MGVPVQRLKNIAIVTVAAGHRRIGRRRQRRHRLCRHRGATCAQNGDRPDHRYLLPASALLGGSLLIFADVIARTIVAPAELPIGIITGAVGGPFFLWIPAAPAVRSALE